MTRVRFVVLLVAVISGCSAPVIPEGRLVCVVDDDCPAEFECRTERCHRGFEDAGTWDAAAVDAADLGTLDGAAVADGGDSGPPDGGQPACDPTSPFGQAVPVGGLDDLDSIRSLTADELTVYFDSPRAPGTNGDLWRATRNAIGDPFSDLTRLVPPSTVTGDEDPAITRDGLTLYFTTYVPTATRYDIYVSTRALLSETFPIAVPFEAGATSSAGAHVAASGDVYFASGTPRQIYVRAKNGTAWDAPTPVFPSTPDLRTHVILDASETIAYFSSDAGGAGTLGELDIWVATRANPEAAFGMPSPLTAVNSSAREYAAFISDDGCRLYLNTSRGGQFAAYVATRSP